MGPRPGHGPRPHGEANKKTKKKRTDTKLEAWDGHQGGLNGKKHHTFNAGAWMIRCPGAMQLLQEWSALAPTQEEVAKNLRWAGPLFEQWEFDQGGFCRKEEVQLVPEKVPLSSDA